MGFTSFRDTRLRVDLRCAIAHRGISRFSDVQLHIVVRCFASPRNDGRESAYGYSFARAAAWPTYFWVCSNAPCSALAVDMSLMSEKCAATASGVQSDCARLTPSVSMI